MSYRRAWLLVDEINQIFREPLVDKQMGGSGGGGARLTRLGRDVVGRYRAIEGAAASAAAADLRALQGLPLAAQAAAAESASHEPSRDRANRDLLSPHARGLTHRSPRPRPRCDRAAEAAAVERHALDQGVDRRARRQAAAAPPSSASARAISASPLQSRRISTIGPSPPPMSATTPGRTLSALRSAGGDLASITSRARTRSRSRVPTGASSRGSLHRPARERSSVSPKRSSWRSTVASMMAPASARPVSGNRSSRCMISAVGPDRRDLALRQQHDGGGQPRHLGDRNG